MSFLKTSLGVFISQTSCSYPAYPHTNRPRFTCWAPTPKAGLTYCSVIQVVDEQQGRGERPGGFGGRAHIVRAEWFWTSVQKEYCLEETDYIVDEVSSLPPFWKLRRMLNMRAAQVQRPPASPVRINNNDYDCDFVTVTMDIDQFQEADCPTCCIIN